MLVYSLTTIHPSGVGENEPENIYYADNITQAQLDVIEEFNKEYEGKYRVVPINLPFEKFSTNERKELLARSFRSKSDRIDVFAVDYIWVYRFAKWAEPLGKYFSTIQRKDIIDYAMESCYVEGDLMAMPQKIDIGVMYYRKDILKEYPGYELLESKLQNSITWKEFLEVKEDFSNEENPFYIFPADNYEGLVCSYIESILNLNRDFFAADSLNFESEEAEKALRLLVEMVNKYNASPGKVTSFKEFTSHDYYIKNNGVFLRSWPTFIHDYNLYFKKENKKIEFGMAPLPKFEGTEPAAVFGGWNMMISKYSKNKTGAALFIEFMLREKVQKEIFEKSGSLPVIKSIYNNAEYAAQYEALKFYKDLFSTGVYRPFLKDYTRISDILSFYVNKAIKKEISVDEALSEANKLIHSDQVIIH